MRKLPERGECIYCDAKDVTQEPATTERGWRDLADEHRDGCEWIETHAHTRERLQ